MLLNWAQPGPVCYDKNKNQLLFRERKRQKAAKNTTAKIYEPQ
jgi:hypothetical protein